MRHTVNTIDMLEKNLGKETFSEVFPLILTDNGSEFKRVDDLEMTDTLEYRTHIYYCDPMASWQKGCLEKNHEYIRYVIPKGRSMYKYTQEDINLMASHINSTARDSLNGATPFDLASLLLTAKIPALAGQVRIPADDVCLKPSLIEDNVSKRNRASSDSGVSGRPLRRFAGKDRNDALHQEDRHRVCLRR